MEGRDEFIYWMCIDIEQMRDGHNTADDFRRPRAILKQAQITFSLSSLHLSLYI